MNLDKLAVLAKTDDEAKAELMRQVRPLVRNAVGVVVKTGSKLPREDLYQEGYIAVLEALDGYDPAKGSFATYIFRPVRGAVASAAGEFYSGFTLPETAITRYRQAMAATSTEAEARQYAADNKMMTVDTFDSVHAAITGVWLMGSLQTENDGLDVADSTVNFPVSLVNRQAVKDALAHLTPGEREVTMSAYGFYGEPMSDAEVATELGSTRPTVQRVRNRALANLAAILEESKC